MKDAHLYQTRRQFLRSASLAAKFDIVVGFTPET
jgi:hypothetical protein